VVQPRPRKTAPEHPTAPGDYFGIGELPPVDHSSDFVKASAEVTEAMPLEFTNNESQIISWALSIDAGTWTMSGSTRSNATRFQAIVDNSGNWFSYFP
jgi:hypothetical protein